MDTNSVIRYPALEPVTATLLVALHLGKKFSVVKHEIHFEEDEGLMARAARTGYNLFSQVTEGTLPSSRIHFFEIGIAIHFTGSILSRYFSKETQCTENVLIVRKTFEILAESINVYKTKTYKDDYDLRQYLTAVHLRLIRYISEGTPYDPDSEFDIGFDGSKGLVGISREYWEKDENQSVLIELCKNVNTVYESQKLDPESKSIVKAQSDKINIVASKLLAAFRKQSQSVEGEITPTQLSSSPQRPQSMSALPVSPPKPIPQQQPRPASQAYSAPTGAQPRQLPQGVGVYEALGQVYTPPPTAVSSRRTSGDNADALIGSLPTLNPQPERAKAKAPAQQPSPPQSTNAQSLIGSMSTLQPQVAAKPKGLAPLQPPATAQAKGLAPLQPLALSGSGSDEED